MAEVGCTYFLNSGLVMLADASGENLSAAVFKDGRLVSKRSACGGALENLFSLIEKACADASIKIAEIRAFGFCRGVGSVLGARASSAALAVFREVNAGSICFAWSSLETYAAILKKTAGEFSVVAPSRKGFANALSFAGGETKISEIPSAEIQYLPSPRYLISQRKVADKNFEGLEITYFDCAEIFKALQENPGLVQAAAGGEIFDAKILSKREYAKWNSAARS